MNYMYLFSIPVTLDLAKDSTYTLRLVDFNVLEGKVFALIFVEKFTHDIVGRGHLSRCEVFNTVLTFDIDPNAYTKIKAMLYKIVGGNIF